MEILYGKDSFLRPELPFKEGNGNHVVCEVRLGEMRLHKNSMINYFKTNDYKLS